MVEADRYNKAGTDYAEAWVKMSKQIAPPHYPPSFEVFKHELNSLRKGRAKTTPVELADKLIEQAKKKAA